MRNEVCRVAILRPGACEDRSGSSEEEEEARIWSHVQEGRRKLEGYTS